MATLIFDIVTIGYEWDELESEMQSDLTGWIARRTNVADQQAHFEQQVRSGLYRSPLTGQIVSIGLYDLEREQGAVYYTGSGIEADESREGYIFKQRTEIDMLIDFWEGVTSYDTFVSFNGRRFDVPFLLHRSAILGVQPSCSLVVPRYLNQQQDVRHVDLLDQLTWYGTMYRKPTLGMFCRAYGIACSSNIEADGQLVAELFANEQFSDLAHQNARIVTSTTELYRRWHTYLT